MAKILYIAEGEIEERFITFLVQNDFIQCGRFLKFNLMQNRLKDSNNILRSKKDKIYCFLDADLVSPDNISNLIFNSKKIMTICKNNVFFLIQNKNFEDELKFLLDCNDLGNFFKLPHNTTKDLKTYLAQTVNYKKIISKKNLIRYCSRYNFFKELLTAQGQNSPKINIIPISNCMI